MKKVLIVTYYWPPSGGPGVQRVLKFAKYLPEFGWQPLILTVKEGEYPGLDPSLDKQIPSTCQVFRTDSIEPGNLYRRFVGMKTGDHIPVAVLTEKNISWKKRLANWIRLNLVLPDAKIGWKPYAMKESRKIIASFKPDIILSSSPPQTVHLIAKAISRRHGIKWVADFRDPWTNIYHYSQHSKNILSRILDKRLERSVLKSADQVTVVSPGFFDMIDKNKEYVLPNGFDPADLPENIKNSKNKRFTIRYIGSFKDWQYVDGFFSALKRLSQNNSIRDHIELEFVGNVDPLVIKKIQALKLPCEVKYSGFLPHDQALAKMVTADMLLLTIGPSLHPGPILTSKIFEYLMAKKPILAFVPEGGGADLILQDTSCGKRFDAEDDKGVYDYIKKQYDLWMDGKSFSSIDETLIRRYERRSQTGRLARLFDELISQPG